jgi:1-deoxy-D-xylulose-5-phosphate synthase
VIHDVALQGLPVIFCIDRAGLVGEDGATHQGSFDLAFLRSVPNLIIASPLNEHELRNMMHTAYQNAKNGGLPFVIRYPRGRGVLTNWHNDPTVLPIGKSEMLREGEKVLVLSLGPLGNNVSAALETLEKDNVNVAHLNVRFLKPLDEDKLHELATKYPIWLTVEDGTEKGGLFSAVAEFLENNHLTNKLSHIAIPDRFISHGDIPNLYHEVGFGVDDIVKKLRDIL